MAGTFLGARRGMSGSFGTTSDSITIVALVRMDDAHDGAIQAINTPGIPAQGSYYDWQNEVRYDLILNSANAKQDEQAPRYWEIELIYESIPSNSDGSGGGSPGIDPSIPEHRDNPLARPAEVTQGYRMERRVVDSAYDKDNLTSDAFTVAVVNSAKERFTDPPLEEDFPIKTWNIVKNISFSDKLYLESSGYTDGVLNTDTVIIDGVYSGATYLRLLPITFRRIRERNTLYYQATFSLERNERTWFRKVLDRGPRDLQKKSPTSPDVYSGHPDNLDGSGTFLAAGTDPVFLEFRTWKALPFNAISSLWY